MSILADTRTGPVIQQDGAGDQPLRQGRLGALIVAAGHGRYYEQTVRKNIFTAYATAQATTAVGTSMVGLQLWNGSPIVGGVNLVILKVLTVCFVTSASVTRYTLTTGVGQISAPTSQTAITRVSNNYIGGPGPQATATAAGTFATAPTTFFPLLHNTAAVAATGEDPGGYIDLEGCIVIPPQCYFAFATVGGTAAASSTDHAVMWEEVPV